MHALPHRATRRNARLSLRTTRVVGVSVALSLLAGSMTVLLGTSPAQAQVAATRCAALTAPVHSRTGRAGAQHLIASRPTRTDSASAGRAHAAFFASTRHVAGLIPVLRLTKTASHDIFYTTSTKEAAAARAIGYSRPRVAFYADRNPSACATPVYRYRRAGQHHYVVGKNASAVGSSWIKEGIAWYAVSTASTSLGSSPTPPPVSTSPGGTSSTTPLALRQPLYVTSKQRNDTAAFDAAPSGSSAQLLLWQLANTQVAYWVGGSSTDASTVDQIETSATAAGETPTFVLYAIPHRDGCGAYSKGGLPTEAAYEQWVDSIHSAIDGRPAIVIIEPDAIGYGCLPADEQPERIAELQYDTTEFASATNPNIAAYIHAGSSGIHPADMARALELVGVDKIRGFAINVSSFDSTASETAYGDALDAAMGTDQPFVIDTGRNGAGRQPGSDSSCNPAVQMPGTRPTTTTGIANVDAFLWIHTTGGSDGQCHPGDPAAGTFVPAWAERYVQNAIDDGVITEYPLGEYAAS